MTEQTLREICEREGVTPRLYRRQRGQRTGEYWHLDRRATTTRRGGNVDVYLCTGAKLSELSEGELLGKIARLKRKHKEQAPPPAPEQADAASVEGERAPPKDDSVEHWPRVVTGMLRRGRGTIHQRRVDNPDVTLCGLHWRTVGTAPVLLTAAREVTCGRCRKSMSEE
jgi:hypothetical protein